MLLTLLRHAKAVDREGWTNDDRDRPLTKAGRDEFLRVAKALRPLISATEIVTSPWPRARQTAEIAAECWDLPLREVPWLASDGLTPAERVAQLTSTLDQVLVGHEPDLGELAGLLCGGRPLHLKKGGLVQLEGEPTEAGMELRLLLTPKAILRLADR